MKAKDRKTKQIIVRLSPAELDQVTATAKQAGVTLSRFVRSRLLDQRRTKKRDSGDLVTRLESPKVKRAIDENGCFTIDGEEDFDYGRMKKQLWLGGKAARTMTPAAEQEWIAKGRPRFYGDTFLYWIDGIRFALITDLGREIEVKILTRAEAILWLRLLGESKEGVLSRLENAARVVEAIDKAALAAAKTKETTNNEQEQPALHCNNNCNA